MIDFHFGHFMLETLTRQWWLKRVTKGPIIWHKQIPHDLKPWQLEIFDLCGIDVGRFHFIEKPIRVRELALAEPSVVIDVSYLPIWAESMGVFPFRQPQPGKKIWMSRSAMPTNTGRVSQEVELEERLSQLGWTIVQPHTMSNVDLLYLCADADYIGSFAGSSFFFLLLAANCRAKIRMVDRGGMCVQPIYRQYAEAKKLDQTILVPQLTHISGEGAKSIHQLTDIEEVLSFLES